MADGFRSFSGVHILLIAISLVLAVLSVVCARQAKCQKWYQTVLQLIAVGVIVQEILNQGLRLMLDSWCLDSDLLIHMCGLMVFILPYAIYTKKRWAIELCYYWGVGGSLVAILTPSLDYGLPDYRAILFFVCHILIFVGSIGLLAQVRYRPSRRGLIMVLVASAFTAFGAGIVSWLINVNVVGARANYWFLLHPPKGDTLAGLMPKWPWYPVSMMGLGLIVMSAMFVLGNLVLPGSKSNKK